MGLGVRGWRLVEDERVLDVIARVGHHGDLVRVRVRVKVRVRVG